MIHWHCWQGVTFCFTYTLKPPCFGLYFSLWWLHITALFDCHVYFCSCRGGPACRHHQSLSAKCPAGPTSRASLQSDWKPNTIHWMDRYDNWVFLLCCLLHSVLGNTLSLWWKKWFPYVLSNLWGSNDNYVRKRCVTKCKYVIVVGGPGNRMSSRAVVRNGILMFPAVDPADEGEYLCKALNTHGEHTARAFIYVQSMLCDYEWECVSFICCRSESCFLIQNAGFTGWKIGIISD